MQLNRAGEIWSRLDDGSWAKWSVDSGKWEQQSGSPPPPPPPPPLLSHPVGGNAPLAKREPRWRLRSRGVVAGVASVIVAVIVATLFSFQRGPSSDVSALSNALPTSSLDGKIALASARAKQQQSFRVAMTSSMDFPQGTMQMKGRGEFDMDALRGSLTMSMTFPGMKQMALLQGAGNIEAVYDFSDGFVMYMKWAQMTQMIDPNVTWMKIDLEQIAQDAGFDLEALMQVDQGNPLKAVDYLEGVDGMEQVGRARVRGVPVTHYRGVVDLHSLLDELPSDASASMKQAMEATGMTSFPMEVWIDDDGLPRRLEYSVSFPAALGSPTTGSAKIRMDYFAYGVPVDIDLPAPDEVVDLMELMTQQQ